MKYLYLLGLANASSCPSNDINSKIPLDYYKLSPEKEYDCTTENLNTAGEIFE